MWSRGIWRPAFAGALAFWLTNFAISLTPVAAEYRSALSISYVPMLVEAAIGGAVIGGFMSWALVRFPRRIPGRQPVSKALVLSLAVLVLVTVSVEIPGKFGASAERPVHNLLIATVINGLRILALGLVVGFLRLRAVDGDQGEGG